MKYSDSIIKAEIGEKKINTIPDSKLKEYGLGIVSCYPKIEGILKKISNSNGAETEYIFDKLGFSIGKWKYNKSFALGGTLDFEKSLNRIVWPALKEILAYEKIDTYSISFDDIYAIDHFFVISYIKGIMLTMGHLPVINITKKNKGKIIQYTINITNS